MKTNYTTLQNIVDPNTRLQVYKEAKKRIEENDSYGLCLLLPMILFDLDSYLSKFTDTVTGLNWDWGHTHRAFPELSYGAIKNIELGIGSEERDQIRLQLLGRWIQDLENRRLEKTDLK